jgi:hypothetical protein
MRTDSRIAFHFVARLLLLGCVASSAPAGAQAPPVREQSRPLQGLRETDRAARAAEASRQLRPLAPGEAVTYDEVLQHPDDVDLNYRFAQTQVARGELRGAASTLERILLLAPDLARVRLLYAVVLYRLDNLNEAEREFRTVSKLPMPDSLRIEVDFYLDQIALRRKTTRYSATLGGGMQWDSNRNAGPDGAQVLFLDRPLQLVQGKKQSDFSGVMLAGLRAQHDLGYDAGHALLGGIQVFGQKQVEETDLDLMALSGEFGGLYRSPWVDVQPGIYGTYMNLAGESYLSTIGTGVRANHRFSQSVDVFARLRFDYEWFESLDRSEITDQRTGARVQGGIGATWTPIPVLRIDAGVGGVYKAADQDFYSYTGPVAFLGGTWLLGRGQFLLSTFTFEYDGYEGPEPIVSSKTRRDQIYIAGLTYGAPLAFLMPFLSHTAAFRDTLLTVNATYMDEQSTIENYRYDDLRFTVMYTKNFEF